MKNPEGISIIVCCHNSSRLLPDTLQHLARLKLPEKMPVELVLVDNASTDNTAEIAEQLWENNARPFALNIVNENTPGLIHARKKGLLSSAYTYIIFVDDDNWLEADYLLHATKTLIQNPGVAACGGINIPVFENEKPFWFDDFEHSYACGQLAEKAGEPEECALFGAGLCIRRKAYDQLLVAGFQSRLTGRSGQSLSSGEDYELVKALKIAGWKIHFNPQMKLRHFITAGRLNWNYLRKLNRGISESILIFLAYEYWIEKIFKPRRKTTSFRFSWQWLLAKQFIKKTILHISLLTFPKLKQEGSKTLIAFERATIITQKILKDKNEFVALKKSIGTSSWKSSNQN